MSMRVGGRRRRRRRRKEDELSEGIYVETKGNGYQLPQKQYMLKPKAWLISFIWWVSIGLNFGHKFFGTLGIKLGKFFRGLPLVSLSNVVFVFLFFHFLLKFLYTYTFFCGSTPMTHFLSSLYNSPNNITQPVFLVNFVSYQNLMFIFVLLFWLIWMIYYEEIQMLMPFL